MFTCLDKAFAKTSKNNLAKTTDRQAEHNADGTILSYGPYEAKISVKRWNIFNKNSSVMILATH